MKFPHLWWQCSLQESKTIRIYDTRRGKPSFELWVTGIQETPQNTKDYCQYPWLPHEMQKVSLYCWRRQARQSHGSDTTELEVDLKSPPWGLAFTMSSKHRASFQRTSKQQSYAAVTPKKHSNDQRDLMRERSSPRESIPTGYIMPKGQPWKHTYHMD